MCRHLLPLLAIACLGSGACKHPGPSVCPEGMSLDGKQSNPGHFVWCHSKEGGRAQYIETARRSGRFVSFATAGQRGRFLPGFPAARCGLRDSSWPVFLMAAGVSGTSLARGSPRANTAAVASSPARPWPALPFARSCTRRSARSRRRRSAGSRSERHSTGRRRGRSFDVRQSPARWGHG